MTNTKKTFVDLFCGSGGLSLGFTKAGYKCELAIDFDDSCIETFRFNHPDMNKTKIINQDITKLSKDSWDKFKYLKNNIDVVCGGPPCQGFSTANRQRLINDPRNLLYKDFVSSVNYLKPKAVLMENVSGIYAKKKEIINDFSNIGFKGFCIKINTKDFNIPQNRVRVLFLMFNKDFFYNQVDDLESLYLTKLNEFKSNYHFTLNDAIGCLPPLKAKNVKNNTNLESDDFGFNEIKNKSKVVNSYISLINGSSKPHPMIYNHKSRYNNERDIEIFSILEQGDDSSNKKIDHINPYKSRSHIFKDKYYKLVYDQACKTITAHMKFDCNMYIHPTQARGLTPREAARVQSYPDSYIFKGPFTKLYMQIGNSVPPLLSFYLGLSLKEVFNEIS